ncbi:MAG: hypothetical protein AAB617_01110 [Patescibacteria group bacterium]|mgnify:CR=1 FL=1
MTNFETKRLSMKSKEVGEFGLDEEDGITEGIQEIEEPSSENDDEGKSEY